MFGLESLIAPAIGGLLGAGSSGGGQQTVSKDPWAPAQDWMRSNITSGQNLQNQYMQNPFSAYQNNAYGNSQQLSQNARSILAGILPQMNGFQGFNRNNPTQTPQGYNFTPQRQQLMGQTPMSSLGLGSSVDSAKAMQPIAATGPTAAEFEKMRIEQALAARANEASSR
jgi:hypothetical protein